MPVVADLVFSTAHKAKGLEFPTVRLTDDYNVDPYQGRALLRNYSLGEGGVDEYLPLSHKADRVLLSLPEVSGWLAGWHNFRVMAQTKLQ